MTPPAFVETELVLAVMEDRIDDARRLAAGMTPTEQRALGDVLDDVAGILDEVPGVVL